MIEQSLSAQGSWPASLARQINDALGIDLRNDLLAALADQVVIYNSPSEGPFFLGITVCRGVLARRVLITDIGSLRNSLSFRAADNISYYGDLGREHVPFLASEHRSQLPAEIRRVLQRGVHALAADGAVNVGGIANEEHPCDPVLGHLARV